MKQRYCILGMLMLVGLGASAYEINFKSNYSEGYAYLTYYFGKNLNIEDSVRIDAKGVALFKSDKTLPGGIYAVVYGDKRFSTEFLVDKDQQFNVVSDTSRPGYSEIIGSDENVLFAAYQTFIQEKGKKLNAAKSAYNAATTKADSLQYEETYNTINAEITAYRLNLLETKPESMMASLLHAMKAPILPEKQPITRQDSVDNFQYYKAHYWDGITFMDDRLVRTPFFLPRLETYYRNVIGSQPADSIIADIDYKMLLARSAPEMYKLLLNWLTDEYIRPKFMGQDAVFVHLFEKYHSKGLSPWLNETQMEAISKRAYMQMANQIGNTAANLEMLNTADKPSNLYDVNATYTVLLFWDPTCGHCKTELPKIDSVYRQKWKAENVKIYAVLNEDHKELWLKYIKDNNISDWIHVYPSAALKKEEKEGKKISYRQLYDVTMTPTLFLLDKDKRIIGKKLNYEQMDQLLDAKLHATKN